MRVGIVTAFMSDRAGGMYPAVHGAATHLVRAGAEVDVFALKDRKVDGNLDEAEYRMHELSSIGPLRLGYSRQFSRALITCDLNLIHTHGIWMYPSCAVLRWSRNSGRPFMVSPHGMLDTWALRRSPIKKNLAGALYEDAHLRKAACIHALCEAEYRSIRSYGLRNPVAIVPSGVEVPNRKAMRLPPWSDLVPAEGLVMLFLGRLHPKKGLANLLRAWGAVQTVNQSLSKKWHLVIAGWDDGHYRRSLAQIADTSGISDSVHFVGPQFGVDKAATLSHSDAFILPSISEGLPVAALEAWTYRLPVLMTQECNLPEGFTSGAALQVGNTVQELTRGILQFFQMADEQRKNMGQRGRTLVDSRFTWIRSAAEFMEVYSWVCVGGRIPNCVRIE
jgi:glycosyltransferase involved in cell wall biosynthesis